MENGLFEPLQQEPIVEALPESPWQREKQRTALFVAIAGALGAVLAAALFFAPPVLVVSGVLAVGYVVLVAANPFAGLLGYLACEFLRFGEIVPALDAIHFQRLVILLVLASWLVRMAVRRDERLISDRQNWTMLGLLAVAALSIANPYWPGHSAQFAMDFGKTCVFYLTVINLTDSPRRLRQLVWAITLLIGWAGSTGVWRYMGDPEVPVSGETIRAGAGSVFLENANDLAVALLAGLPLVIYLLTTTRRWARAAALLVFGVYGCALVCTGSRGGFLGALAVAFGVWLTSRHKVRGLALLAVLLAIGWLVAPATYRDRMASLVSGADPDGSFAGRLQAWGVGLRLLRDRPLLGAGAGNFQVAFAKSYTPPGMRPIYRSAHSLWFETAGEVGLLGLLALGWFLSVLVRGAWRLRAGPPEQRQLANAVLIALLGLAVAGTFASLLWHPYLYLLAALCVVIRRLAVTENAHVRDLRPVQLQ